MLSFAATAGNFVMPARHPPSPMPASVRTARTTNLITGITGQDERYLAKLLLQKEYVVQGIKGQASSIKNTNRIDHRYKDSLEEDPMLVLNYIVL